MNVDIVIWKLWKRRITLVAIYILGAMLAIDFFIAIAWIVTALGFGLNILN